MKHKGSIFCVLLLVGCQEPAPTPMSAWLGGGSSDADYKQVVKDALLSFPDDHQAHPDFRHEWWYFTANLTDQHGQPLGLQWTQFRFATAQEADLQNPWQANQIYMAHSAVTSKDKHYSAEKWSRAHSALAGVEPSPLRVFLDDWQWQSTTRDLFPAKLQVQSSQFSYNLQLASNASYHKQGEQGYSQKNATGEVASYYYTQPFIEVSGEVTLDGKRLSVSGTGWLDREWSSAFLLGSQQGWDWFALRLDPHSSLVLFQLRSTTPTNPGYRYARIMQNDGSHIDVDPSDISLIPQQQTRIQGRDYPTKWQLNIKKPDIKLTITALNPAAKMPLSVPYWEGPVTIKGTHQGSGYMELTGY